MRLQNRHRWFKCFLYRDLISKLEGVYTQDTLGLVQNIFWIPTINLLKDTAKSY